MLFGRTALHQSKVFVRGSAAIAALGCLVFSADAAQVKLGSAVAISSGVSGLNSRPGVAANSDDDELLLAWIRDTELGGTAVVGQRTGAYGDLLSPVFSVSAVPAPGSGLRYRAPAAVYNADRREYFVVYYRDTHAAGPAAILGRRFSVDGSPRSEEALMFQGNGAGFPAIAWDSSRDRYLVAWRGESGLQGRLLDGDAAVLGDANLPGAAGEGPPTVMFNRKLGRYLLAFGTLSGPKYKLMAVFADTEGHAVGRPFPIAVTKGRREEHFTLALNPAGTGFFAAWSDVSKPRPRVFARRFDSRGRPGGPVRLLANGIAPQLAFNPYTPGFLAAWETPRGALAGQLLKFDLRPFSRPFTIFPPGAAVRAPVVAAYPDFPRGLIVWFGGRTSGGTNGVPNHGLYGQRIDLDPSPSRITLSVAMPGSADVSSGSSTTDVKFNVFVTNEDSVTARNVKLQDWVDGGGQVSVKTTRGWCPRGNGITCELGDLAPGETAIISIKTRVVVPKFDCSGKSTYQAFTRLGNTATVTWGNYPTGIAPVREDNEISVSYTVC